MEDHKDLLYQAAQVLRHLRGELNETDEQTLKGWLDQPPEYDDLIKQLTIEPGMEFELAFFSNTDRLQAWANLQHQIDLKQNQAGIEQEQASGNILPLGRKSSLPKKISIYAAAVAAIVVVMFGVWFYTSRHPDAGQDLAHAVHDIAPGKSTATLSLANGQVVHLSDAKTGVVISNDKLVYNDGSTIDGLHPGKSTMLTASTPRGGTYQITLPDGTHVWLNADSKISFPSQFIGEKRRIILEGEAYFEVAKNKRKPFIVESSGQEVTVLGTHFNINAYKGDAAITTTLLEGSVKVSMLDISEVILKPNQQSIITGYHQLKVREVNAEEAIDWKEGYFKFSDNENIRDIMPKVARWYNVEVNYIGDMRNINFTGSISRAKNISAILKLMEATRQVSFKIEGRKITATGTNK